jgi:POT family proton-dependent oligopeptide transporter
LGGFKEQSMDQARKSLYYLVLVEIWERFGYYLIGALLVYYLTDKCGLSSAAAFSMYGTFAGATYLAAVAGGFMADRVFGARLAVLVGAVLLTAGYATMALYGGLRGLYLGAGLVVLGTGLFKPSMGTLVGQIYGPNDSRRDGAFSLFYLGVNIGALAAPIVGGLLRSNYGYSAAFGAAAGGMLIALLVFYWAYDRMSAPVVQLLSEVDTTEDPRSWAEFSPLARTRVRAMLTLCGIVVFFWVCFQQNGSTLALWARDNTDLTLGGRLRTPIDPTMFAAVNSFFIIVLTPVVLMGFRWLARRGLEPSTPAKLGLGMCLCGAAYGVMVLASLCGGDKGRVSALWLITSYFLVTLAELFVSPVGLSLMTKLAPRAWCSVGLGVWYLGTSTGNKLAGEIGVFWDRWSHHNFFGALAIGSLGAGWLLALNRRWLEEAMPAAPQKVTEVVVSVTSDVKSMIQQEEALRQSRQANNVIELRVVHGDARLLVAKN